MTTATPVRIRRNRQLNGAEPYSAATRLAESTTPPADIPRESISRENVRQHLLLTVPLAIVDILTLTIAFATVSVVVASAFGLDILQQPSQILALGAIAAFIYSSLGMYHNASLQPITEFRQLVTGSTLSVLMLTIANIAFARLTEPECWTFCLTILVMLVLGATSRGLARRLLAKCSWWLRPVIIAGGGSQGERLCLSLLQRPWLGFRPVGFVDDMPWSRNSHNSSVPYLGSLDQLSELTAQSKACWVMVLMARRSSADVQRTMQACCDVVPNVVAVSNMHGVPALGTRVQECGDTTGIHFQGAHLMLTPHWVKRALDIAVTVCGSLIVVPVSLVIAAAIKIVSPTGPVLFGHTRLGRDALPIRTWKFRTMVPDADRALGDFLGSHPDQRREWETLHKLKNDPRVIPYIGKFLRKFSLDELPQLWNVLTGDMSLVGPRPIVADEVTQYAGAFTLYKKVRPGITGLWQISGRNDTTYRERIDLDIYYVTNWSPWLDLYILVRTIRTVLLHEGAY